MEQLPKFPHTLERVEFNDKILDIKLMIQPSYPAIVSFIGAKSRVSGDDIILAADDIEELLEKCCISLKKEIGTIFIPERNK